MGNDTSKSTIENQQLIMQLQQQILNNQRNQQPNLPNINIQAKQQNPQQHHQNPQHMQPNFNNQYGQSPHSYSNEIPIANILQNKQMLNEIDKNPTAKRKMLEKLLNEQRHIMTTQQIQKISQILNTLPPMQNDTRQQYVNPTSLKQNSMYRNTNEQYSQLTNTEYVPSFNHGTTLQDRTNRQLQTTQQYNDAQLLSKHYQSEAEAEEAAFKLEEARRKAAFLDKQHQRRAQYQSKLMELEKHNIDALKLFQLAPNYTLDELKAAYKKMAMKTHPDKPTGNKEQFQIVTKCYMSLLEKYKNRESDKQFTDLRTASKTYIEDQKQSNERSKHMDKDKFDVKLFNKIYEQNKLWDSNDDGYGDFMKSEESPDPPTEVFGNKFNLNIFNTTFENHKDKLSANSQNQIQLYNEPSELVSSATGFTEIDIFAKKVDDFSKPLPVAGVGSKNELAYTDLKTAYTGRGAFIDPSKVEYKTYKSVDELKRDRGNIRFDMTPEQQREYELRKMRDIEAEEHRQSLIRERDNAIATTYGKIHEKMLGYKGKAPG